MAFFRHISSLLYKEWYQIRHSPKTSVLYVGIPFALMLFLLVLILCVTPKNLPAGPDYIEESHVIDIEGGDTIWSNMDNALVFYWKTFSLGKNNWIGIVTNGNDFPQRIYLFLRAWGYQVLRFKSEKELIKYAAMKSNDIPADKNKHIVTGVSFQSEGANSEYNYKLYFDKNIIYDMSENFVDPLQEVPQYYYYHYLQSSGLLFIKTVVDSLILRNKTGTPSSTIAYGFAPMKYEKFNYSSFGTLTEYIFGLFFLVSTICPLIHLIGKFMDDKNSRLRDSLKVVGLRDSEYFLGHFLFYALLQFVCIFGSLLIIFFKTYVDEFSSTNYFLFASFCYCFALSIFPFSIIIKSIFNNPLVAKILGGFVFYLIAIVPFPFLTEYHGTLLRKLVASIIPQISFLLGVEIFGRAVVAKKSLTFDNVGTLHSYGYKLGYCFAFFFIDFLLYMLIALYLDNVLPSGSGHRKPFYYFLQPSYWGCASAKEDRKDGSAKLIEEEEKENNKRNSIYEKESDSFSGQHSLNQTLKIREFTAQGKENILLDPLDLDLFTGQIFALLGKTNSGTATLIDALVGYIPPRSGTVHLYGTDMINDIAGVQEDIGICREQDSLFDALTLREHLEVIAQFRGLSVFKIEEEIGRLLEEFKLQHKDDLPVKSLSTGERRKLSICMALLANPRLLILEEPTRGMDTVMKKEVWDILKNYKRDRIIIVTSQSMEEAESIGDRIGIMVQGRLACCGSAMFLKKHYGIGYHLHIIKSDEVDLSSEIIEFVPKYIPGSEVLMNVRERIEFKLPFVDQEKYQNLFNELENNFESLGICEYGVWITTLEDVFLKVGESDGEITPHWSLLHVSNSARSLEEVPYCLSDNTSISSGTQFKSIFTKVMKEKIRNIFFILFVLVIPVAFCLITIFSYSEMTETVSHHYSIKKDFPESVIYVNNNSIIDGSISTRELMANFGYKINGRVEYYDVKRFPNSYDEIEYLANYSNSSYSRNGRSYSSYYIYQADTENHNYSFVTIFNLKTLQSGLAFSSELASHIFDQFEGLKINTAYAQFTVSEPYSDAAANLDRVASFTGSFSFAIAIIPGLVIMFLLKEKKYSFKAHLMSSGVPLWIYWLGNFLVDIIALYSPILVLCLVYTFKTERIQGAMIFLTPFPLAFIAFTYFCSLFFKSQAMMFSVNFFIHIIGGEILPNLIIYPRIYTEVIGILLCHILCFIPSFAMVWGLNIIANAHVMEAIINKEESEKELPLTVINAFDWNIGLQPLVFLILSFPLYLGITFFIEYRRHRSRAKNAKAIELPDYPYRYHIDENVQAEEQRVQETHPDDSICHVQGISLGYKKKEEIKIGVSNISFAIEPGEIFCILGPVGSGKSTIMKILSGVDNPNRGEVFIRGENISENNTYSIGYCPERSVKYDNLTVFEHFNLYAGIKGIPVASREKAIAEVMDTLQLTEVSNVSATKLTAGNQRKLSVGIALLGNPPLVLLDEPTLGIDPKIKHDLWGLIANVSQKWHKSAFIITTQSLDEAEALSTKMAILINGTFRCLGAPQIIKRKYAVGYYIEIKFDNPTKELAQQYIDIVGISYSLDYRIDLRTLQQMLESINMVTFSNKIQKTGELSELYFRLTTELSIPIFDVIKFILLDKWKDQTLYTITRECGETQVEFVELGHYRYRVRLSNISVGKMFSVVEELKDRIPVHDYSVMQPTLGEVFHQFAEMGEEEIRKYEEEKNDQEMFDEDADSEGGEEGEEDTLN